MTTPFTQHIESQRAGQIAYRIATVLGAKVVVGRRLSKHFAAERGDDGTWHLSHLPSGRCLPGVAHQPTWKAAAQLAAKLEGLAHWSLVRRGSPALARKVRDLIGGSLARVG